MAIDADTTVKISGGGLFAGLAYWFNDLRSDYRNFKKEVYAKFEAQGDEISENAILSERSYVAKEDLRDLRTHLNGQFDSLHSLILNSKKHD